jgi:hypothetical protein
MDDPKAAREKLQRIRQLWLQLDQMEEDSPEYEILAQKIRALSTEYKALSGAAAKRVRSAKHV